MNPVHLRPLLSFALFACFAVSLSAAESPTFIPFQGRITDQAGSTYASGQYTILFQLYDQAVGGQAIWQERHDKVGVINGLVNVFLGSINPLTSVSFDSTKHLGITIDADNNPNTPEPEMIPRQMIIPAFWAKNSEKLAGQDWTPIFGNNSPLGALPASKIQSKGITAAQIAPGAVGNSEIATNGVRTVNIQDGQITTAKLSAELVLDAVIPPGSISAFGGNNIPAGWLLCDGRAMNSANYPKLYAAIGTAWGDATDDGLTETNFRLPDMRGLFLRGGDLGSGNDPDSGIRTNMYVGGGINSQVGSFQSDQFKSHTHATPDHAVRAYKDAHFDWYSGNSSSYDAWYASSFTADSGGTESRPKNVYVNYIIKY